MTNFCLKLCRAKTNEGYYAWSGERVKLVLIFRVDLDQAKMDTP